MVTISAAPSSARATLENLMQLYVHDWSEHVPLEVDEQGLFRAFDLAPYFDEPGRHAFLIRVDEVLAGFALVSEQSRLSGARGVRDLAEFFVLRRHRRRGVGRAAATLVFERFPGPWEVRQRAANPTATVFWRNVVAENTGGRFEETTFCDAKGPGVAQRFVQTG